MRRRIQKRRMLSCEALLSQPLHTLLHPSERDGRHRLPLSPPLSAAVARAHRSQCVWRVNDALLRRQAGVVIMR
jgi:hypothetical protein